ncbi:MAG TPA: hypothetical protein VFJ98_00150 [Mycobacteriales bacterium]|nr:hypothetical protein [Mycobacteriales bacterium]
MTPARVGIIGSGRLARALVARLPPGTDLVVLARRPLSAPLPRPAEVSTAPDVLAGVTVVVAAVPGEAVGDVIATAAPVLSAGTVVCNAATDAATPPVAARFPDLTVVGTKFIGQAGEIERGARGVVVVDGAAPEVLAELTALFAGIGPVVAMDESAVLRINTAVAEEMVRAVSAIRGRLAEVDVPPDVATVALSTLAVGILRSLADGTAGPFVRRIVDRLAAELPGGSSVLDE